MKTDVLLGLQWGDEGKGKIVDVLTPKYDIIARFQGGPNAGHTLEFSGKKFVLHSIPSGIFQGDSVNVIGNGVVLDPITFRKEIEGLSAAGFDLRKNLIISKKAHMIIPSHRILDAASEAAKGKTKIGSTLKGIGPTYMDKTGRNGLRVGDILRPDFWDKYNELLAKHELMLKKLYNFEYNLSDYDQGFKEGIETMRAFKIVETEYFINEALQSGKTVLAEGAQGTLLDVDFGSYPYVTSSNTIAAGASIGLGIGPNAIGEVYGIFKAYCTRVGGGPFPTELFDQNGIDLQNAGNEFGSTTGRSRRCGWIDLTALKYAIMINGVTKLIMTKADVLSDFGTFKVAVGYTRGGIETQVLPYDLDDSLKPVLKDIKGWNTDISGVRTEREFPQELNDYIKLIEDYTGVPIAIVSVGPDREATIVRNL